MKESPFLNVDNEALLYPSPQLQEGVARMYYLIDQERTAGIMTGPYGVGKTFLLSCLVRRSKSLNRPLIRFDAIPDGSLPMRVPANARLGSAIARVPFVTDTFTSTLSPSSFRRR